MTTPNYNLPQWDEGEKTDWFQLNGAFSDIDTAMHTNAENIKKAQDSLTAADENIADSIMKIIDLETALSVETNNRIKDKSDLSNLIKSVSTQSQQNKTGLDNLSQSVTEIENKLMNYMIKYEVVDFQYLENGVSKNQIGQPVPQLDDDIEGRLNGASNEAQIIGMLPLEQTVPRNDVPTNCIVNFFWTDQYPTGPFYRITRRITPIYMLGGNIPENIEILIPAQKILITWMEGIRT